MKLRVSAEFRGKVIAFLLNFFGRLAENLRKGKNPRNGFRTKNLGLRISFDISIYPYSD